MRGLLPDDARERINAQLPTADERLYAATMQTMSFGLSDVFENSNINAALVALEDAGIRFYQVRLALEEALQCLEYYRTYADAPNETTAIYTSKIYADHATFLYYAMA